MIYADNAATTKMSPVALAAMLPALEDNYGNPSSLHSVGQHAAELLQSAREAMARCLNCKPREILFTSGGSEADNQALLSASELGRLKGKKHIISTAFEHHAVLHSLKRLEKQGFEVTLLPVGPTGTVTAQQVKEAIRPDTCLVTVRTWRTPCGRTPAWSLSCTPTTRSAASSPSRRSAPYAGRRACCSTPTPYRRRDICPLTSRPSTSIC